MRQFQYVLLSASLIYTLLSALIGWLVCDINFEGLINKSLRIINLFIVLEPILLMLQLSPLASNPKILILFPLCDLERGTNH